MTDEFNPDYIPLERRFAHFADSKRIPDHSRHPAEYIFHFAVEMVILDVKKTTSAEEFVDLMNRYHLDIEKFRDRHVLRTAHLKTKAGKAPQ